MPQPHAQPKLSLPRSPSPGEVSSPDQAAVEVEPERSRLNWRAVALVASGIALTSAGHYLTPSGLLIWHGVFQRLYYLPVVFAAITFGWVGGLVAALAAGVAYIPHIMITWSGMHHYAMEQYAEIFMFLAVGVVTGILADRERKRRIELQHTAQRLSAVYRELQLSFEQVKRADRLSAIGQLAAGLAHEIRNPLASIDGAAELLNVADDQPELRMETVSIIRKECARLNRLLTSLLDFARPRRPEWRDVDLSHVLDTVIDLVGHSAGKGIRFHKEQDDRVQRLLGDEEQLTQVVLNLTLNAAQAMPSGGDVWLTVRQEDGGLVIQIRDEGPGIPEEHVDKIFDPFFTTKETGTGLGLSVVHQIVTQHGGNVTVSRNQGKGTTFTLFFPQSRGELA
jgi:two-component system sensor histidine kinase HydH